MIIILVVFLLCTCVAAGWVFWGYARHFCSLRLLLLVLVLFLIDELFVLVHHHHVSQGIETFPLNGNQVVVMAALQIFFTFSLHYVHIVPLSSTFTTHHPPPPLKYLPTFWGFLWTNTTPNLFQFTFSLRLINIRPLWRNEKRFAWITFRVSGSWAKIAHIIQVMDFVCA